MIDWRVAAQRHVEPVPIPKMLSLAGDGRVAGRGMGPRLVVGSPWGRIGRLRSRGCGGRAGGDDAQGPISAAVLLTELTGQDRALIVPILLAVITATMVSRTIGRSQRPPDRCAGDGQELDP